MRKRKKGKFWTFIFSFLPGAAEMYMGFMKKGISIMALFFICFIVPVMMRVSDILILIAVLVWFYGFFHARNMAAYSESELQEIPDEFIWESVGSLGKIKISDPAMRKWGAAILIIYGLSLLWQTTSRFIYALTPETVWRYISPVVEEVPQLAVACIIIALGAKLVAGKKEELTGPVSQKEPAGQKEYRNREEENNGTGE